MPSSALRFEMKHSQLLELPSSPFTRTTKCVCGPAEILRGTKPASFSSAPLIPPRMSLLGVSAAGADVDGRTDSSSDSTQEPNQALQSRTSSECDLSMLLAAHLRLLASGSAFHGFRVQFRNARDACMRARSAAKDASACVGARPTIVEKILPGSVVSVRSGAKPDLDPVRIDPLSIGAAPGSKDRSEPDRWSRGFPMGNGRNHVA